MRRNPNQDPYVLVVDDHTLLRETLGEVLEDFGYEVRLAADGAEALICLERDPHCGLMLLDREIAPLGAESILSTLRADRGERGVPVVLLSSQVDTGGQASLLECEGHLSKPIALGELLSTLTVFCGSRSGFSHPDLRAPAPSAG